MVANEIEVIRVRPHLWPRQALRENEILERRLQQDLLRQLQTPDRHLAIQRVGKIVRIDPRRAGRVGAGQPHGAA